MEEKGPATGELMNQKIHKIVILGPESTGKSTLCQQLAAYFNTFCCPEFAREYLTKNGIRYTFDDLLVIAKGQLALEDDITQKATDNNKKLIFIDTDMNVMKVWCEFIFNNCHPYILKQVAVRQYDYYLLCDIDLEWKADPLREYPDLLPRQRLFKMYKDILVNQTVPWSHIYGSEQQRLQKAIESTLQLANK